MNCANWPNIENKSEPSDSEHFHEMTLHYLTLLEVTKDMRQELKRAKTSLGNLHADEGTSSGTRKQILDTLHKLEAAEMLLHSFDPAMLKASKNKNEKRERS